MMTIQEMVRILKGLRKRVIDVGELDEVIAALESEEVLAEEGATVYIRGSRAYAMVGSGMIRLDTSKGLRDGQQLCVRVLTAKGE